MSLFLGGGLQEVDPRRIELATAELESYTTLYINIIDECKAKCFPPYYSDEELSKGEMCCVDRCTAKFFKANLLVGEYFRQTATTPGSLAANTAPLSTLGQNSTL